MSDGVSGWLADAVSAFGVACEERLGGAGEAEAAIRPPIEGLLQAAGSALSLHVVEHGEAAVEDLQVRPDYAIRVDGAITGYVEVKKPRTDIDPSSFGGHNRTQWERLQNVPNLIYTNGHSWALFRSGELVGEVVHLDGDLYTAGAHLTVRDRSFERLLRDFLGWRPVPITSVKRLVQAVAPLCLLLRKEVVDQLTRETRAIRGGESEDDQPFTGLASDWRRLLFPTASDDTFADGYAQAVTFALLLARVEGIELAGRSLHEVGRELGPSHSLMGRALQLLTDPVSDTFRVTLDLLVRVIGAVEWEQIRAGRADAYLHLYEHFLGEYDEALRRASGSYYTPREVVVEMVRLADEALRGWLGCERGFLSHQVVTVDPAMGTDTYLHAIIQRVAGQIADEEGPGAAPGAVSQVIRRLVGFELQMGPYAVAELRASDLVHGYGSVPPSRGLSLYVTDALDDPHQEQMQLAHTFAPLARSRREANRFKRSVPVTVVIGNPPYKERAEGLGGWVEQGNPNMPAPLDAFRLAGNGRVEYVLKNLYVYFWRWATWKVFDAEADGHHGLVTFISTSGYLRGPGFKGMREYLRRTCEEGWIVNVSPEGHRPDVPTRVFPGVQQPLAIGLFVRRDDTDKNTPARLWYAKVHGRRENKYAQLARWRCATPRTAPARCLR
ncbi:MAG: N-6 DNA methylase [Streptosporangiaceae bacterium]